MPTEHQIRWNLDQPYLVAFGDVINCSCIVRNEINGLRQRHEVVNCIPADVPYQPRRFPIGKWTVSIPRPSTEKYTEPYFIPTDAFQILPVWSVDENGYVAQSERWVKDTAYGLHYSCSSTTLGCIRIHERTDLLNLVKNIIVSIRAGDSVTLTVRV